MGRITNSLEYFEVFTKMFLGENDFDNFGLVTFSNNFYIGR